MPPPNPLFSPSPIFSMNGIHSLPDEVLERILTFVIITGFRLLPCPTDTPINDIKFLTEDCELAAEYDHYLLGLELVCKAWKDLIRRTCTADHWFICNGVTDAIPSASRVQYRDGDCECDRPRCPFKTPRRTAYIPCDRPTEAFLSFGSVHNSGAVTQIIAGAVNRDLRLLAVAVDFTCPPRFSLPALSESCPNLTHLSLSDFDFPDGDEDQTLDLPELTTLALNLHSLRSYASGASPETMMHPSFHQWNLPSLQNLSLKGFVDDDTSPLFKDIHAFIYKIGPKLQGLTYYITSRSQTKEELPQGLPPQLWIRCPNLHSIQVPLIVLFAEGAPIPPKTHPKLTITPSCHGNLKSLPGVGDILWPGDLFDRLPDPEEWPIERFCASSTWSTFHRKLVRHHQADSTRGPSGEPNDMEGYWRDYFHRWIVLQLEKGYTIQDRYGVDIREGAGAVAMRWLSGVDEDVDMVEVLYWAEVRRYEQMV